MKKQAYTMIALIVLFGYLTASVKAQCALPAIAKIPFQFSAGKASLPAGEYEISCSYRGTLSIRSTEEKANSVTLLVNRIEGRSPARWELRFHRYGSSYFFVQSWSGDSGFELPMTAAERALKRELARVNPKAETVSLKVQSTKTGTQ